MSSLDKPPPSRYRVEEKDGRLIVHDSQSAKVLGRQFSSSAPGERSRAARDAVGATTVATPQTSYTAPAPRPRSALDAIGSTPAPDRQTGFNAPADQEKAKRGAIVGVAAVALIVLLAVTSLWPIAIVLLIIAPIRAAILERVLPAIKLYIAEGRWS